MSTVSTQEGSPTRRTPSRWPCGVRSASISFAVVLILAGAATPSPSSR